MSQYETFASFYIKMCHLWYDTYMSDFVIGDISGFKDAFDKLICQLPDLEKTRIVALGDIIDRGPQSKEMIQFFIDHPQHITLMGNHEHMFIKTYESVVEKKPIYRFYPAIFWIYINGGKDTLKSYGINVPSLSYSREELKNMTHQQYALIEQLPEVIQMYQEFYKIPLAHIDFLRNLSLMIETPTHIYTHAPMSEWNNSKLFDLQEFESNPVLLDHSCLWSRNLPKRRHGSEKMLVYGHDNKKSVLAQSDQYRNGYFLDPVETTVPDDTWALCLDTAKEGFLTGYLTGSNKLFYQVR